MEGAVKRPKKKKTSKGSEAPKNEEVLFVSIEEEKEEKTAS